MNTSIITVTVVAAVLFITILLIWKLTSKKSDITEVDIPEITPEELKKMADEAEEEKCEEVIEKAEEEYEEDEEDIQTVEEYVTEIASKLVDSEGSLTSTKLETEDQSGVLVISESELKAANEKFEESLKTIGIDPVTGCYVSAENRKVEKTVKLGKKTDKPNSVKNKKTNKTVKEQASTKKKLEKHPEKANKSVKNNNTRQNKAVNGKKNKKKTNKK